MEEREKIELSNHEDYVLRIDNEAFVITGLNEKFNKFFYDNIRTFVGYALNYLHMNFFDKKKNDEENYEEWFDKGRECAILKPSGEWQTGKVRFKLKAEFFPDKPEVEKAEENGHQEVDNITESPLDEIRQQLTDEN
jgi:hypothetical protein